MKKVFFCIITLVISHCAFAQWTLPGTNINNTNTGNVGIGTTAPVAKLSVYSDGNGTTSDFSQIHVVSNNMAVNSNNAARISFNAGNGTTIAAEIAALRDGYDTFKIFNSLPGNSVVGALSFGTNNTERMRISGGGNVGIGTTSPLNKLDVAGDISLSNSGSDILRIRQNISSGGYSGPGSYSGTDMGYGVGNGGKHVWIGKDGNTEIMRLDANGRLGLGTNAPLSALDVSGDLILRNYQNYVGKGASIVFTNYGDDYQHSPSIRSYLDYAAGTESQTRLILSSYSNHQSNNEITLSNGSVGIGTIDPQGYKLAVNGSAIAESVTVKLHSNWPDYVFKPQYILPSLADVKTYIDQNQRLPDMPSEDEVAKNGINLGEIIKIQTKKIEELTLYLIDKDQKLQSQQTQIDDLKKQLDIILKNLSK